MSKRNAMQGISDSVWRAREELAEAINEADENGLLDEVPKIKEAQSILNAIVYHHTGQFNRWSRGDNDNGDCGCTECGCGVKVVADDVSEEE